MDKYRKVIKPKDTTEKSEEEIRLTAQGSISSYVSRAAKVFNELEKPKVVVTATGNALTKAVSTAEVIKRRFKGLHQITKLASQEIVDEYEPLEEGLDKVTDTRSIPCIEITLSKEPLDTSDVGYQPPLDDSEVKEIDLEEMTKPRGRGRGKGKGKGKTTSKGKGKGKGKDEPKGKGKKGKGKGKEEPKGKGKGTGKEEPKGKGKGKGKGKSEPEPKGKGKGKSKDSDKGKGKSKDKGKGKGKDYGYGYDSYSAPSKGKGKSSKGYDSWGPPPSKGKKGGKKGGYDDYWSGGYGGGKSKGKGKSKGGYSAW